MDQVFPGLNNVARHIRPFVVVTWAWRRARQLAEQQGLGRIAVKELRDFVDRIEVIYAWSQFLRNPDSDLPGRRVLSKMVQSNRPYYFGGADWRRRCKDRRYSTGFTAPINYGPGLKTLRWVEVHEQFSDILIPTPATTQALDAFEAKIKDRLEHPAFSQFGPVEVSAEEVEAWAEAWALDRVTDAEKRFMAEVLFGRKASLTRQSGGALVLEAEEYIATEDVPSLTDGHIDRIRNVMAGRPTNFVPPAETRDTAVAWRRVQVRQLFRLSLEALLYWLILQIEDGSKTTRALVTNFLAQCTTRAQTAATRDWLEPASLKTTGPTDLIQRIEESLSDEHHQELAASIADALAFCLAEAPKQAEPFERADRLPLARARREAEAWSGAIASDFVRHILESWVLAQHVYWSVGRGLADARAGGKTILRLRIALGDSGWELTSRTARPSPPVPTPDRLKTALSLALECGLIPDRA